MESIKLNLIPSDNTKPVCHASQYDNGRRIRLELYDGEYPYILSDETIELDVKKGDGNVVTTELDFTEGNAYVDMITTEQMTAIHGQNFCELKISKDETVIYTKNFILKVEQSVLEGGIQSESEIHNLQTQIAALVEEEVDNQYDSENVIFDSEPTAGHGNGYTVTSSGLKTALDAKANQSDVDGLTAELVDIRTGADGKTYASAGDAVRGQVDDLQDQIDEIKDLTLDEIHSWDTVSLDVQNGYYNYINGNYTSDSERRTSKLNVSAGEKYKLSTYIRPATISGLIYFNAQDAVVDHFLDGTGTGQTITDYEFTIPNGVASIAVQCADSSQGSLLLKKYNTEYEFVGYTKTELSENASLKFGIRWNMSNPDDLGERCFGAVGLNATIGIGSTDGSSDFDSIYPWSEIKRCNIKTNANGAKVVTFEGETGFALDGSNGDVFVRIPKFYIEKYRKNGYEYRIISSSGSIVHPAFIEDGKELDEIFVGAFEGFIDSNDKLTSIAGVIPTSNVTAQTFLTSAQSKGDKYSLYDMRCVDAIWMLMAIEFGCRNTNQIIGYGLADFEQPTDKARDMIVVATNNTNTVRTIKWTESQKLWMPIGSNITICDTEQTNILTQAKLTACVDSGDYTDWTFDGDAIDVTTSCFIGSGAFKTNWCESSPSGALSWHTGRNNWISNSNTKNAVRYRWIENVVGNLWHLLPDITFNNLQMYICRNMKDYVMHKYTSPYEPVGALFPENRNNGEKADVVGSNYWITEIDNNIFTKGVSFGRAFDVNLVSTKAFGAYYYLYSGNMTIANGGGFDHLYRCNMLTQRAWINYITKWYLYGARLIFKNIS